MPISRQFAQAIGKLFRNLQDHKWYGAEAAKQAASIYVIHPLGHKAYASLHAHLFGPKKDSQGRVISEELIASAYKTEDDHEYIVVGDKHYRHVP